MKQPQIDDSFPQRLKHAIANRSIRAFARDCNCSDTVMRQYLSGQSEPTRPVLIKIAHASNTNLNWLITGQSDSGQTDVESSNVNAIKTIDKSAVALAKKLLPAKFIESMMSNSGHFGLLMTNGTTISIHQIRAVHQAADHSLWLDVELREHSSASVEQTTPALANSQKTISINATHIIAAFESNEPLSKM